MRARIKFYEWVPATFSPADPRPFARISVNKKKFQNVSIAPDLGKFLEAVGSVDISNKPFPKCIKKEIAKRDGHCDAGDVDGNFICGNWLRRLGLEIYGSFYVKVNRK
jgi:hypothetical protein